MCSLIGDISYSLSGTLTGDIDVAYDLWLVPKIPAIAAETPALWRLGCFRTSILPLGYAGTFVRTFTETVTVDGTPTSTGFLEYADPAPRRGAGSSVFFYYPSEGIVSGEVRADLLDFMNEAVTTAGLNSSWWAQGIELGTELGDSSSQNFTFSLTKLDIEQAVLPTPTPAPTPVPAGTTLRITSCSFGWRCSGSRVRPAGPRW